MQRNIAIKILLLLSLFVTGSASADWMLVLTTKTETYYMDPSTVVKEGNLRRIWVIRNKNQRDKKGIISFRSKEEYDCANDRLRVLAFSSHSEPMAEGNTITDLSSHVENWREIPPRTVNDFLLKTVCLR